MQTCYEKHGVLHRNINPGSLMFKAQSNGSSGLREGVLVDFDFATHVDKRSNTIPFVAIDILRTWHEAKIGRKRITRWTGISHLFPHKLESIFYVFCWICIVIAGPNFTPRPQSDNFEFGTETISLWFPSSSCDPNYAVLAGHKES